MFLKVQLPWNVVIPPDQLDPKGLFLQRAIIIRLLEDFSSRKATKDHGYFVALTTLESIGDGKVRQDTGDVLFPVVFNSITLKPFKGEIVTGLVNKVMKTGVFLTVGPIKSAFLPVQKMSDYKYVPGENPFFLNERLSSKIEKDVEIRFMILGTKWIEIDREFQVLGSLEGDYLGPVSSEVS